MPVEIRELQITTVVNESTSAATSAASSSAASSTNTDAIISACVEQVLEILKEKNER
jgi:hypothetical protein